MSIKAALEKAGVQKCYVEFDIAIAKLLNSGGTIEGAQERLRLVAERMTGMGHDEIVDKIDHTEVVDSSHAFEDDGAIAGSPDEGLSSNAPSSSSNRGGDGQIVGAAGGGQKSSAVPARTARGSSSIRLVQSTIQKGLLELKKTADGRSWGRVGWHELDGMDRDGSIARLIKANANPPKDKHAELRTVLSNKQFEEICDAAEKQNDFV